MSDIDRSLAFYRDQVGFSLDIDTHAGEMRVGVTGPLQAVGFLDAGNVVARGVTGDDGGFVLDQEDEIVAATLLCHAGDVVRKPA